MLQVVMGFGFSNFIEHMKKLPDVPAAGPFAIGVSGGPDSMALLYFLSAWAAVNGALIYAYTVDHALRPESGEEAATVGEWVKSLSNVRHDVLRWEGEKPSTRILEEARIARYGLMRAEMEKNGIRHLFVAHHRDDQAETFLIRLAKGSGLDGLSGMAQVQETSGIAVVRPLLDVAKEDLVEFCRMENIPFVDDPTNENDDYLRPRLRAARAVLEEEGLSAKRIAVTASRIARARAALEGMANICFERALKHRSEDGLVFDAPYLKEEAEEMVVRVILKAMHQINPVQDYPPRLEKVEHLCERIRMDDTFKGATLGGCLFSFAAKGQELRIIKE